MKKLFIITVLILSTLVGYSQTVRTQKIRGNLTITGSVTSATIGTIGSVDNTELGYLDGVTSAIQTQIGTKLATTTLTTLSPLLRDTVPLFTFGAGGGNAGDTIAFTTSTLYGSFYNGGSDTLVVTQLIAVLGHGVGTDTLDVQVQWHATFKSGSATKLNTNALPVVSITTGTIDASFANSKIPPGVWVWCTTPSGITAKRLPIYLCVTLSGYKIQKY
jgi:hypothetical protein